MGEGKKTTMRDHLGLDVAVTPPAGGGGGDALMTAADRIQFFRPRSHGENTWVVSLFVVLEMVAFVVTMFVNDCPRNSDGRGGGCVAKSLGRFSFQPISENPLLGPSSSTLDEMGALQWTLAIQRHQEWRLVTCSWLHAGVIHLVVNLLSIILVGIRLEQDYGPLRIGMIYLLSSFLGSLVSALFVQHSSSVGSSGALFGLLGALLSGLIQNWQIYDNKFATLVALSIVAAANLVVGLLPHVDNFSNFGGILAGFLLGFVLLFNPQLGQMERKKGLFDFNAKSSVKWKQKLDMPAKRIVALVTFTIILAGSLVAVLHGVKANDYCSWCHYFNCFPTKMWSCSGKSTPCEAVVSNGRLTLTCKANNFRTFRFANISQGRMDDLCTQFCS